MSTTIDADALLRSLEPVVARPESTPTRTKAVTREVTSPSAPVADAISTREAPTPTVRETPVATREVVEPAKRPAKKPAGARAKMDVAINPGEGSTALYVRVPRTVHVALKLLALQNQAALEGPQDLASVVRTAIDEYLERNQLSRSAQVSV
ncbi:MAG: hypothetical protein QM770_24925 [Tepidisphaeraceae bacterium]